MARTRKPTSSSEPLISQTPPAEATNKPVHTIRYGAVKATVWQNDSENGIFHTVTVSRSWRDDKDQWHDSQSFHFKELPQLSKAVNDAHSWIAWQERRMADAAKTK